jgi:hypothetical protein
MALPNLLHRTQVTVQQIVTGTTRYDEDTREPIQQAARDVSKTVPGQVLWGADRNYSSAPQGPDEGSDGYVLFRYVDLRAAGLTLAREDRISRMGHLEVDVYIQKLQPMGHYADQNGPALVRAYFKDRQPSKQTRG